MYHSSLKGMCITTWQYVSNTLMFLGNVEAKGFKFIYKYSRDVFVRIWCSPVLKLQSLMMYVGPDRAVCTPVWLNVVEYEFYINMIADRLIGITKGYKPTSVLPIKWHTILTIIEYLAWQKKATCTRLPINITMSLHMLLSFLKIFLKK